MSDNGGTSFLTFPFDCDSTIINGHFIQHVPYLKFHLLCLNNIQTSYSEINDMYDFKLKYVDQMFTSNDGIFSKSFDKNVSLENDYCYNLHSHIS